MNPSPFKQEIVSSTHWLSYSMVLIILMCLLWLLAKKAKPAQTAKQARLIEKFPLHAKAHAYVIDYQGQHFLIAENQNALAIHPLPQQAPTHHGQ